MDAKPFADFQAYEAFLYALSDSFPAIRQTTVVLIRSGKSIATTKGEVFFREGIRLVIREQLLSFDAVEIEDYGYEVWQDEELLYWYDSQPHPHIVELQATHPHHKHLPPDIKHNRVPAPGLSFTQPNLPFLIAEIEKSFLASA